MKTTGTSADYQSEIKGQETTNNERVVLDAKPNAPPRLPDIS